MRRELRDPAGTFINLSDGEFARATHLSRASAALPVARPAARHLAWAATSRCTDRAIDSQISRLRRKLTSGAECRVDPHRAQRGLHAAREGDAAMKLPNLSIFGRTFLLTIAALIVAEGVGLAIADFAPAMHNAPMRLSDVARQLSGMPARGAFRGGWGAPPGAIGGPGLARRRCPSSIPWAPRPMSPARMGGHGFRPARMDDENPPRSGTADRRADMPPTAPRDADLPPLRRADRRLLAAAPAVWTRDRALVWVRDVVRQRG